VRTPAQSPKGVGVTAPFLIYHMKSISH